MESVAVAKRKRYKRYPVSVQKNTVEQMQLGLNVSELAEQIGVHRTTLYQWKKRLERSVAVGKNSPDPLEQRDYQIGELRSRIAALEGELGRTELEKRFFERALRRVEALRQQPENSGETASSPRSATR